MEILMNVLTRLSLVVVAGAVFAGCATTDQVKPKPAYPPAGVTVTPPPTQPALPEPPAVVVPAEPSASEKNLTMALASFERGEYNLAMKQLSPLTTETSLDKSGRIKAIKTLAFAQCLTRAVVACRKTFEKAFQLDAQFDLAPAEQGHPVWGPQFERARKATQVK
ncbi:MAG: TssQ family T6SS-associated lipoprotein [Rhodoferax sp.]|nr:TssQ family T6SS-associated lipoprotein [Rhodoferax sp.]